MTNSRVIHVPYTVKPGDTLTGISQRFLGNASRFTELAELNGIENANLIQAEATIMIPVPLGPDVLKHPAMLEALKPERKPYPLTRQSANAILQTVMDGYQPTWDRDLDLPAEARAEGVVALGIALGSWTPTKPITS